MILGITGGTGGGKTTVLRAAEKRGALVLDCDEIYHELLCTCPELLAEIEERFPGTVENGVLARKKLGKLVFADENALRDLNAITHCHVCAEVERRLGSAPAFAVIDAIGLLESGLDRLCGATVAVTAPVEARVARLMAREGIEREYALSRIRAQKPDSYFTEHCTYTLHNDYPTREAFEAAVDEFLDNLLTEGR